MLVRQAGAEVVEERFKDRDMKLNFNRFVSSCLSSLYLIKTLLPIIPVRNAVK